jgi:hypothetical protein
MSHTVKTSVASDAIVSYAEYRFRLKNVNAYGSSAYSEEIILAAAPLPTAPAAPTKNQALSTTTSISVSWLKPSADIEP